MSRAYDKNGKMIEIYDDKICSSIAIILPKQFNNCNCECHYVVGINHCFPCCGPGINDHEMHVEKM